MSDSDRQTHLVRIGFWEEFLLRQRYPGVSIRDAVRLALRDLSEGREEYRDGSPEPQTGLSAREWAEVRARIGALLMGPRPDVPEGEGP